MSIANENKQTDQEKLKDLLNKANFKYTENNDCVMLKAGQTEVAFLFNPDGSISTIEHYE